MSSEEIFKILKDCLIELFEMPEEKITLEAHIYDDLDIDSIDAIDIVDHIRKKTGYRMEAADFKEVRVLGDIVRIVEQKLNESHS